MADTKFSFAESKKLDQGETFKSLREEFYMPKIDGKDAVYFVGNSLGLQPKKARAYVDEELDAWAALAVEGHFKPENPWYAYHETVTEKMARIVGAQPSEVVCMNTLTVNLHLMMVSFYRPTQSRHKILIESGAFSSDQYAISSQIKFHGFDPKNSLIELSPRNGEETIRPEDILKRIDENKDSLALVLLGNVNYRTGQCFDMEAITKATHKAGATAGFDLAHGAGNLLLKLHDWNVDFAVWCSYKYLNAGPGGLAGAFIHERHGKNFELPRFAGWWGHDKKRRFEMASEFMPMSGAEGWQLSNPPIFPLAALRASLEIFDRVGMEALVSKSKRLSKFFENGLREKLADKIKIITPSDENQRGCHLSLRIKNANVLVEKLGGRGVFCDNRGPDILRAAPVPLYNTYEDVFRFVDALTEVIQ